MGVVDVELNMAAMTTVALCMVRYPGVAVNPYAAGMNGTGSRGSAQSEVARGATFGGPARRPGRAGAEESRPC